MKLRTSVGPTGLCSVIVTETSVKEALGLLCETKHVYQCMRAIGLLSLTEHWTQTRLRSNFWQRCLELISCLPGTNISNCSKLISIANHFNGNLILDCLIPNFSLSRTRVAIFRFPRQSTVKSG